MTGALEGKEPTAVQQGLHPGAPEEGPRRQKRDGNGNGDGNDDNDGDDGGPPGTTNGGNTNGGNANRGNNGGFFQAPGQHGNGNSGGRG